MVDNIHSEIPNYLKKLAYCKINRGINYLGFYGKYNDNCSMNNPISIRCKNDKFYTSAFLK